MPIQLKYIQPGANKTKDDVYYLEILCAYEIPYEYSDKIFLPVV